MRFSTAVWFEHILSLLCLITKIFWHSPLTYNSFEECTAVFVGVHWTVVGLSVLGKIGASTAFATIYLFSAELFPTVVRNSAMGVSSLSARIGGMISPYIAIIVSHLTLGLIEMNHVVCVYRREINCQLLHACYHIFFVKFYDN